MVQKRYDKPINMLTLEERLDIMEGSNDLTIVHTIEGWAVYLEDEHVEKHKSFHQALLNAITYLAETYGRLG